ncbi:hypothetical protein Rsub_06537 [Raphidocelis subcapitata]|uniref:Uncharacterized protein n=1 Tax=Raphidocelis subcapitata TaxID=307507 RepID=A0A2V0PAS6_9CHLO|nr:hypothetical protein Rsub_06537 [Raphidocelis subcapitata]|eukprot:GBF94267.1 hypothetical protein Rsub_06537 [Raphidocelis subcapitata]
MQTRMRPQALGRGAAGAPIAAPRPALRSATLRRSTPAAPRAAADGGGSAAAIPPEPQKQLTVWGRVKRFFVGDGLDKERLKALGMGAFASYGFISNLNYGTALTVSWLAFKKKFGVSPLSEGQWPAFLAFYGGEGRPLRLSAAIALAPAFDRGITAISEKLRVSKAAAFGIYLGCMAVVTSSCLFGALFLFGGF